MPFTHLLLLSSNTQGLSLPRVRAAGKSSNPKTLLDELPTQPPLLADLPAELSAHENATSHDALPDSLEIIGGGGGAESRPSVRKELVSLSLPILGAVLIEPIQSMIDTAAVGHCSSTALGYSTTAGIAALSSNTALFNLVSGSCAFLCTATTALVARSGKINGTVKGSPGHKESSSKRAASLAMVDGLFISTLLGAVVGAALFIGRRSILTALGVPVTSAVFKPAEEYLVIRAVAWPASMSMLVMVGTALGLKDAKTAAISVIIPCIVNIIGDVLLSNILGMGVKGAAIATAASLYAGATAMFIRLRRKLDLKWRGVPKLGDLKPFFTVSASYC